MLEIDISINSSQNLLGIRRGDFWGSGCPNDTQTPYRLRLRCHHLQHRSLPLDVSIWHWRSGTSNGGACLAVSQSLTLAPAAAGEQAESSDHHGCCRPSMSQLIGHCPERTRSPSLTCGWPALCGIYRYLGCSQWCWPAVVKVRAVVASSRY